MLEKKNLLVIVSAVLISLIGVARAEVKIPTTAEDHLALAKQYREKAATYKKEADEHREMAAKAKSSALNAHKEHGQKDPYVAKMEKHCAAIAAKADALAKAEEKAADFHELRAKELQGK
jgi:hypothetical protein